uniref:E3 ubiquitin-protein ligase listerin n=1 Tax=Panagrolaimus superbus TaxID=310955 RepID=A0A914Z277_9BILA
MLDSFFDGTEIGLPLFSWTKAFAEAIKFSFLKAFEKQDSKEFQAFLVEKDKKDTVPIVVDLLTWLQSKDIQSDGDGDVFKKQLSQKLITKLPVSIFILEPFIEASNDFTIAVELLKSHDCPNSTFLKVFKLIDEDAVDTSQFGIIIARRIHSETDFNIQQRFIKVLWDLIDDKQVKGEMDTFLKVTDPLIARNLVEISSEDLIDSLKPASREKISEIVLTEVLKGHRSSKLAEWINKAIPNEYAVSLAKKAVNDLQSDIELKPFLDFINVTSSVDALAACGKEFFEILFELVFKHETTEDEEKEIFKAVKQNAGSLGKHFNQEWINFIHPKIALENFSFKDIVKLSKLLASLSLTKEQLTLILPSEAAVKHLITNVGSMFILNIVCEPEKHRLFEAIYYGKINPGPIANLSSTTRFAVFYSYLAFETSKNAGVKEKGIFAKTSLYALLTELAIEYKSENGLFSTSLNDFQGYHELYIIIDKILQDTRFDYRDLLETIKEPESRSHLVLRALNDHLKTHGRRHISFDIIDDKAFDGEDGEAYHMVRVCEEVGRKTIFAETNFNAAINWCENYINNKQQDNASWLFNVEGRNEIRDAASCSILKLFGVLIENVELKPKLSDFMLCGFVCAMQTITDNFHTVEGRHYFYSHLAAVYCLQLFHLYDTIIAKQNRNAALEWNEFYRPAAVGHIMSWVFALEPSANAGFPQYLINKICLSAGMLTPLEIKEALIPDEISSLNEPLGLGWDNYDEKSKVIIKFAIRLLFGKSNDTVKFLAVFLLKSLMFDMYDAEKLKAVEELPPTENAQQQVEGEDDETMEQQLKELKAEQKKKLPELFEKVLSPQSSSEIKVLPKLMVWDSLIHFLSELDVITRVQYTLALPGVYTDEILNVLFELLPKDPEKRLKELSYKGKLSIQHLFAQKFDFHLPLATTVDHYICNLFYRTLSTLPSIVRTWYMDLPRSRSGEVHDYIKRYITPLLIARELNSLGNVKRGRLTVKVLAAVNEIDAAYSLEDATLSLKISLPDDYPLSKPIVDTHRAIVNKDLLRKWLLQLILFLSQQNGLMLDGILQWKRNIDNHLEGIEDCTICMMTVSTTNYSLPKIKCKMCKKKFHGDCLYKWFDTSNNATCPLCRSPFYY